MRPLPFPDFVGQEHLVAPDAVLRKMIKAGTFPRLFSGTSRVGKTPWPASLRRIWNALSGCNPSEFRCQDVRDVIQRPVPTKCSRKTVPFSFIDEIHRFSKSQQDALLGAVEDGTIVLIGATYENPSFEVIAPLFQVPGLCA